MYKDLQITSVQNANSNFQIAFSLELMYMGGTSHYCVTTGPRLVGQFCISPTLVIAIELTSHYD